MIACPLLRIAVPASRITMLPIRLHELVSKLLFTPRLIATIDKSPPVDPVTANSRTP